MNTKDGNGYDVGMSEEYHTHTYIVSGYKLLAISVPTAIKLYPYPYSMGTRTHSVPDG
jgi:hypothetical protein